MKAHALIAFLVLGSALSAAPITVHNTGVNNIDVVQSIASPTSFWLLESQPTGAGYTLGTTPFRHYNGAYYADNALSGWVSPAANGFAGLNGIYVYRMTFDLTGLNSATASISGTFGTDNSGSMSLNGNAPVATTGTGNFNAPTSFSFTSGFVAGINTIRIGVNNEGDPTAFRVEFNRATADLGGGQAVPEPGTAALLFGGLALAWAGRKRLKQR